MTTKIKSVFKAKDGSDHDTEKGAALRNKCLAAYEGLTDAVKKVERCLLDEARTKDGVYLSDHDSGDFFIVHSECGCSEFDLRYTFPGPGGCLYLLTLSRACMNCDSPSGVSIERIQPGHFYYGKEERKDFTDGELKFEQWSDTEGVAIITGMLRSEFIAALSKHLIGVSSEELGVDGKIDRAGADVILEEMYADAIVRPHFPPPSPAQQTPNEP